jgi:3-phosphoshikimate 1-carboxyvinyltransferase
MKYQISASTLQGEIAVPPSKSQTLRAILFGALGSGKTQIHHYLHSPDTEAMISACRQIGATLNVHPSHIDITGISGQINGAEDIIQAGNSGLVLRFMTAIAALSSQPILLTGDLSIRSQRPMQPLLEALTQLGAKAISTKNNGFAPLIIQGPLKPGPTRILGEDSQFVSALLIAGAFCQGPLSIKVDNAGEKPWVALTLDWLKRLAIPFENDNFQYYTIKGPTTYPGFTYNVPGDFSSAAFPLIAGLVTGSPLRIQNLDRNDPQGDKKLITHLQQMGAPIEIEPSQLILGKPSRLKGLTIDINDCIDALPALAVVACFAEGETLLTNAKVARTKECDRLSAMTQELGKMGARITELPDSLIIRTSPLKGAKLSSHGDHRIAMALSAAAMAAKGQTQIEDVACVAKTFPHFASEMQHLGANIQCLL